MWEGACPRLQRASQSLHRLIHRYRGQAPSYLFDRRQHLVTHRPANQQQGLMDHFRV
ncbi:hypothetical protein J2Y83_001792 [Pseudomonas marginalis]|nr:hypothetical protein [Pseudomonas marginalis]MCP1523323.1 hypothetical protein [Pseudomonas marginalis]MDQ0501688.1 hypothetical protein [Pseudomonas marginalis]